MENLNRQPGLWGITLSTGQVDVEEMRINLPCTTGDGEFDHLIISVGDKVIQKQSFLELENNFLTG